MLYGTENQVLKMLLPSDLKVPALQLLGHVKFHRTSDTLAPHCHQGMEFIVVLKGTQQYVVDDRQYTLKGGDVFMTFPNEVHGNGKAPQEVAEIVWFQLDCSSSENFLGLIPPFSNFLFQTVSNYKKRITHVHQKELCRLRRAFELLSSNGPKQHLLGYNYFMEFVINNLCEDNDIPVYTDAPDYSRDISAAIEYIQVHLTENPALESLAEHCGMSLSKFNAQFKEQMGVTPHAYIMNQKLALAKTLLKNSENTVTDVAFQLNFSSSDYFSSVFKKYTGCTPTQYRQSCTAPEGYRK